MISTPELVWKLEEHMGPLRKEGLDSRFVAWVLGSKLPPHPCPSSSFLFPVQQGTLLSVIYLKPGLTLYPRLGSLSQSLKG